MIGIGSETGEFERGEFGEMPGKQGPESRTGLRFEASACHFRLRAKPYNPRVKQSLMPFVKLKFGLAHRCPWGYGHCS